MNQVEMKAGVRAGDTIVQNGTRHVWRNRGDVPVRLVTFIVGAHHAKVPNAG
jgi:hypothetical protein